MEDLPKSQKIIGNYEIRECIGKGTFGKVCKAVHLPTSCEVAVKVLDKALIKQDGDFERVSRQIRILRKIRHRHVIQLYEVIETSTHLYLIIELASHDLFSEIVESRRMNQTKSAKYFRQLMLGLEYCLRNNICHRDIKPENILISDGEVKITDFGLSNVFGEEFLKTACGSPSYAPPEMLHKKPYNPKLVDVWSSGVTLYAMVFGRLPFEDSVITGLYQKIKRGVYEVPDSAPDDLKEVFKLALKTDPSQRASIQQLLKVRWLSKYQQLDDGVDEINVDVLTQVCSAHQISRETLESELKQNRHNNRTTTYYLSIKLSKKGDCIRKNSDDRSVETEPHSQVFIGSLSESSIDPTLTLPPPRQSIQKQNTSPNQLKDPSTHIKIQEYSNSLTQEEDLPREAPQSIKQLKPPVIPSAFRKVSRMKPEFMKKTAVRLNQRSVSITKTMDVKHNKSVSKNSIARQSHTMTQVDKKPLIMNSLLFFVGKREELRDLIRRVEPKQCSLEYSQVAEDLLYITKYSGDSNKLIKQLSKLY